MNEAPIVCLLALLRAYGDLDLQGEEPHQPWISHDPADDEPYDDDRDLPYQQ
jgi:hypothetical protein